MTKLSGLSRVYAVTSVLACLLLLSSSVQALPSVTLTQVARRTVEYYFASDRLKRGSLAKLIQEFPAGESASKQGGLFVTLSRRGQSRACWGSLTPVHKDLVAATVYATVAALTHDYRFRLISSGEWEQLKVQVTVVKAVEPIHSIEMQNPLSDGLMVRAGGKSGILLPGEARDAYYQLVKCKLKAGIRPGEPCQLYRIRADVYQ